MVTTVRAAISAALLAGFYLLAAGVVAALGWLAGWLWQAHPGAAAGKVSYLVVAVGAGIVVALWKVARARPEPPEGVVVDERQAPELWATVRELAGVVQTRTPDEIRLVAEVNAAVTEDSRWMGLVAGRRYLYLGVPLLQALTVDQLRAVLAHELGHYSHSHTRLGELTYRGQATIIQTIRQVGPSTMSGRIFKLYARLYFLVSLAVSRRMELEADQAAVRAAGRDAAATALRELPVIGAAWGFYLNRYVAWGLDSGYAPRDVLAGFAQLLAARGDELARLRAEAPDEERSRWDSHPPIGTRVAVIMRGPDLPGSGDRRPSTELLPGLGGVLDTIEQATFDFGDRRRVPFGEYTARASQAVGQREADVLYRAAGRVARVAGPGLGTVFDLLQSGRRADLIQAARGPASTPGTEADGQRLAELLHSAFTTALVRAGAAFWRYSWSEPAALVRSDGSPFPVDQLVEAAATGRPDLVARVRADLRAYGVDESGVVVQEATATATGADVVAAVSDVKVDDELSDVLVANTGLIVVPSPGKQDSDVAKRRLAVMATQTPLQELTARPGARFLPFEEIADGRLAKKFPVTYELTMRGGAVVTIKQTLNSENLGKGFEAIGLVVGGIGRSAGQPAAASG